MRKVLLVALIILNHFLIFGHGDDHSDARYDLGVAYDINPDFSSSRKYPRFVKNQGQWQENILYKADMNDGWIYYHQNEIMYQFYDKSKLYDAFHAGSSAPDMIDQHAFKVSFVGANTTEVTSSMPRADQHQLSYFNGDLSAANVTVHDQMIYKDLYDGITMVYTSFVDHLKYDFHVEVGKDPRQIQMLYEGADSLTINSYGNLAVRMSLGSVIEYRPIAYQVINGIKEIVPCEFAVNETIVSFKFPKGYNSSYPLVIDPSLLASTYSGSTTDNWGFTAANDDAGLMYVAGIIAGSGYPVTVGAFQSSFGGGIGDGSGSPADFVQSGFDVSISVYSSNGSNLLASTYLGGSGNETPHSLIVDKTNGNIFLMGKTNSPNFPTSVGAYDGSHNGMEDMYIVKFNNSLSTLLGGTFVGGSQDDGVNESSDYNPTTNTKFQYGDAHRGQIVLDNQGNVYAVSSTHSSNFPTTAGAYDQTFNGVMDAVVVKMNSNLTSMIYSTFVGGDNFDAGIGVTVDAANNAYITGITMSTNYPTTVGALNTSPLGSQDAFVSRLDAAGSNLVASTLLGTIGTDGGFYLDLDNAGGVHVLGLSYGGLYPVTAGTYSNPGSSKFIQGLDAMLSTSRYSTVYGSGTGVSSFSPTAFYVDSCDRIIATGWGETNGMPVSIGAYKATTDNEDFHFIILEKDAASMHYASFFGENGVRDHVDGGSSVLSDKGIVYQAVCASCLLPSMVVPQSFPTTPGAWSNSNLSVSCSNAIFKFDFDTYTPTAAIGVAGNTGCVGDVISFTNASLNATSYQWDFGDGSPVSTVNAPSHVYTAPGSYTVELIAFNPLTCLISDTFRLQVDIFQPTVTITSNPATAKICDLDGETITLTGNGATSYVWNPGGIPGVSYTPTPAPSVNTTYTLIGTDANGCTASATITVVVSCDNDNDGISDSVDLDDDNDGILDTEEDANLDGDNDPMTNPTDSDGDGIPNVFDLDSDNDGITDVKEAGGNDVDGDGIIDGFVDADGNGWDDPTSQNPLPNGDADNDGNKDVVDIDADNDGIVDNIEGQSSSGYMPPKGLDSDGDGIDDQYDPDAIGGTPITPIDTDTDGMADYIDTNSDGDAESDLIEGWDTDGDGTAETVPSGNDTDGDGLDDNFDNNDLIANPLNNPDNNGNTPGMFPNLDNVSTSELDWREIEDNDGDGINDNDDLDDDNDGIPDTEEDANLDGDNDPTTNPTDSDQDGIPDVFDLDSDNDGITDVNEAGGNDVDGDGIIDGFTDTDGNGWDDATSQNPLPNPDTDGDGNKNVVDIDADNDGIVDNIEGQSTSGYMPPKGLDSDGDGIDDQYDPDEIGGTAITPEDTDSDGMSDYVDTNSDGDMLSDLIEGWDTDGDGTAETLPSGNDSDGDGLDDNFDNNNFTVNPLNNPDNNGNTPGMFPNIDDPSTAELDWREVTDNDNDGISDDVDLDDDNDGIPDTEEDANLDGDNDPMTNPTDTDNDGIPDVYDLDSDNDGITDVKEAGGNDVDGDGIIDGFTDADGNGWDDVTSQNPLSNPDTDGDGVKDVLDIDSDNDGIVDNIEGQSSAGYVAPKGQDTDGDGIDDQYDVDEIGGTPITPEDTDGDGSPDYVDTDADNDGEPDIVEGWDTNGDGTPETVSSGNDTDGDGLDDNFDNNDLTVNPQSNPDNNGNTPSGFPNIDDSDSPELDWREYTSEFFVPEGFSPNGDGVNDFFEISGIDKFPNNTFTVFNRWGTRVLEREGYKNDWDGVSEFGMLLSKEVLPIGTYFYILDLGDGTEVLKGIFFLNK